MPFADHSGGPFLGPRSPSLAGVDLQLMHVAEFGEGLAQLDCGEENAELPQGCRTAAIMSTSLLTVTSISTLWQSCRKQQGPLVNFGMFRVPEEVVGDQSTKSGSEYEGSIGAQRLVSLRALEQRGLEDDVSFATDD